MSTRLKVLVCAYACSPYQGSEPGVGWGFVHALAEFHDLWVIVEEEKFRADIEHFLRAHPALAERARFFFLRKRRNRLLRALWPPSYYRYYRFWHRDALALAEQLHAEVKFDLVHQLTMVGFREPGYLWQLDIPFVWGPVGGMGLFPWSHLGKVGFYGAVYYLAYNLYNMAQMRFMSRPRDAARMATGALLTATPENRRAALRHWGTESTVLPETGLPCEPAAEILERRQGECLRVIWTGIHAPRKALNLGLEALALLPRALPIELSVLGEGQRTPAWKALSTRLGIAERCAFLGWLPREEALRTMKSAHVMLITSLRDLTSTVVIEALAMGLPIVCVDHCGFAHVVDDSCGIKVPLTRPSEVILRLSQALERLAADEKERRRLARGAIRRAMDFGWRDKAAVVDAIYRHKIAGKSSEHARVAAS